MNPWETMIWKENDERDLETNVSVAMPRIAANKSNRVVSVEELKMFVPGFVASEGK